MMLGKQHNQVLVQQRAAAGFTLVELMIALVLGLLIVAGVGSVFLANQNAYRTNVALGELQESARTSFEFLAREIRAAGANPCGTGDVESILNTASNAMLNNNTSIEGWDDASTSAATLPTTGAGVPVAGGGDAIRLASARSAGLELESTGPRTSVTLSGTNSAISSEDILMVCDIDQATIFQVTKVSNKTLEHAADTGTPGNQIECLNNRSSTGCTSFSPTSYLAIPMNYIWYVGTNNEGGRSLFRFGRGQKATNDRMEMVRGVQSLTTRYHERGGSAYVTAANVGNWESVDAVRMMLTVRSGGTQPGTSVGAGTDSQPLERTFTSTVAIRNRLDIN